MSLDLMRCLKEVFVIGFVLSWYKIDTEQLPSLADAAVFLAERSPGLRFF